MCGFGGPSEGAAGWLAPAHLGLYLSHLAQEVLGASARSPRLEGPGDGSSRRRDSMGA